MVNLTGSWGSREVTEVVGKVEENIHTEVSCLDKSHTDCKISAQFTNIRLLSPPRIKSHIPRKPSTE